MKFYLIRDLKTILNKYPFGGNLIDVGCGEKPYKNIFKNIADYKGIDFKKYSKNKDMFGEAPDDYFGEDYLRTWHLPYKDSSFDVAVCFQVLEHHPKPEKLIDEMFRIVKNGAFLLLSFPLIGGIHEKPHDFFRFTEYVLMEFVKERGEILEIKRQGSIFSVISQLSNEYLNNFAARGKGQFLLSLFVYLPFLLLQYISLFLDKLFPSKEIFLNYLVLIKK